jgi:hypothetical protein
MIPDYSPTNFVFLLHINVIGLWWYRISVYVIPIYQLFNKAISEIFPMSIAILSHHRVIKKLWCQFQGEWT